MASFNSYHFGCRVNEAEKEAIDQKMLEADFNYKKDNPDVFIINTCAVTHKAEREARQLIYRTKKQSPQTKIVVTGCAATYWNKNEMHKDLPVDMLVDNLNKEYLAALIKKRLFPTSPKGFAGQVAVPSSKFIDSGRLLVKIQDGCHRFCTFCIVPYLKGLPKWYKIEDLIGQINNFQERFEPRKVNELILTAINTEAFGYDSKEKFVDLVDEIIKRTDIPRISFGSVHPWTFNAEFFGFYQKAVSTKRLVNFFHIPLQSGSNTILTLMKRGYRSEEFTEKLNTLAKINPQAFISTDVIVGFLSETDKEFRETYKFLEESPISKFHVFRFSKRQRTAAYYLAKRLEEPSAQIKIKRAEALIKLSKKKYRRFMEKQIGRVSTALILEKKVDGHYQGVLDNQIPVILKTTETKLSASEIINVRVTEFNKNQLLAKLN